MIFGVRLQVPDLPQVRHGQAHPAQLHPVPGPALRPALRSPALRPALRGPPAPVPGPPALSLLYLLREWFGARRIQTLLIRLLHGLIGQMEREDPLRLRAILTGVGYR